MSFHGSALAAWGLVVLTHVQRVHQKQGGETDSAGVTKSRSGSKIDNSNDSDVAMVCTLGPDGQRLCRRVNTKTGELVEPSRGRASVSRDVFTSRLWECAPVMLLNLLLPFTFPAEFQFTRGILATLFGWITNFKLIGWCFQKGPLAQQLSVGGRLMNLLLPTFPLKSLDGEGAPPVARAKRISAAPCTRSVSQQSQRRQQPVGDLLKDGVFIATNFIVKMLGFASFLHILDAVIKYNDGIADGSTDSSMHILAASTDGAYLSNCILAATITMSRVDTSTVLGSFYLHFIEAWCLYMLISVILESSQFVFYALSGEELLGSFDAPYFSTSLSDFWGRRWNLAIGQVLRTAVYEPIACGAQTSRERKMIAVIATFMSSGIMHVFVFHLITDVFAGEWFWFFFLQGVACVIESQMKYLWKKKLNLPSIPPVISIPLTLTLLMIFAELHFFPPVDRTGIDHVMCRFFNDAFARFRAMLLA